MKLKPASTIVTSNGSDLSKRRGQMRVMIMRSALSFISCLISFPCGFYVQIQFTSARGLIPWRVMNGRI